MEKYVKPIMEVVELDGVMETFVFCTTNSGSGSVNQCAGGVLSYGGGGNAGDAQ